MTGPPVARRRNPLPWHPAILAAVVVLTLWLDSAVSPYAAIRPFLIAYWAAIALTLILALALRSLMLGGIIVTAVIGLLWSRNLVVLVLEVGERMGWFSVVWAALLAAAFVIGLRMLVRRWRSLTTAGITTFLNRGSLLLLVATLGLGLFNGRLTGATEDLAQGSAFGELDGSAPNAEPAGPDIYAILLDGYPRADVLEYAFGIDNADFIESLEARGFDVAPESHSDYLWTHVSVPSALNMAYVEQIPALVDVEAGRASRQPTLRRTVANNAVFEEARAQGYTTVAVGAGFEEVAPRLADVYVDGGELNEFELGLLSSTYVGTAVNLVAPDFASGQLRDRIRYNLAVLPEVAGTIGRPPLLVFAHVPAPHQPTVMGAGGAPVVVPISDQWFADSPMERGEDPEEFRDRYRAQLPVLNELILDAIDGIVASSSQPPVILLFADHGSASEVDWNATTPAEAEPARLLERTGAFFAALTPEAEDVFPDDISPVDMFRLTFDAYFGTDYGRAVPPPGGGHVPPIDASVLRR